MTTLFEMSLEAIKKPVYWFNVKEKYSVRINVETNQATCTCQGDTFRQSGKKQNECKHIREVKKLVKIIEAKRDTKHAAED